MDDILNSNSFLAQSVMQRGIPFEIKIPNKETAKVIKDARDGKNISKISIKKLKEDINAWYCYAFFIPTFQVRMHTKSYNFLYTHLDLYYKIILFLVLFSEIFR